MKAKDLMTTPVLSVPPLTLVTDVAALLLNSRISGLPVIERGKLVGIVCGADLVHRAEIGTDEKEMHRPWWHLIFGQAPMPTEYVRSHGKYAADVMTTEVITVDAEEPIGRITELFDTHHIRTLPVTSGAAVVGIVTRSDLVKAVAEHRFEKPAAQSDETIREQLVAELESHPWWFPQTSSVFVAHGVVSYRGLVRNEASRRAARVAAENISGVRGVRDDRIATSEWEPMA
jgi:CBS domain-containing protein